VARKEAEGKRVEVEVMERGPYGRLIGRVHVGGTTLGRTLARSGYAWHSRRYGTSSKLKAHEREARARGRGLWTQESPVPPWQHRNGTPAGSAVKGAVEFVGWALATVVFITLLVLLGA
jgi:endonuclease YncB( thermonuclease family)